MPARRRGQGTGEGRCSPAARRREPAPVSEDGGKNRGVAARSAKVYRCTGAHSDDRRTGSGTMPSVGAELRTARRRGHRPGTVRCSRWGGTAPAFRIVIAKPIGMKYLGGQRFAGRRATKPWGARLHCSLRSEYCQNHEYMLKKPYLLHSKMGLNGDAWLRRNGRTAA